LTEIQKSLRYIVFFRRDECQYSKLQLNLLGRIKKEEKEMIILEVPLIRQWILHGKVTIQRKK
jgi:hypothetical protein